ncbi:hypothetical protein K505DRAFT_372865, partial [Melanomma pulvis-pyrius CBS 109.77]
TSSVEPSSSSSSSSSSSGSQTSTPEPSPSSSSSSSSSDVVSTTSSAVSSSSSDPVITTTSQPPSSTCSVSTIAPAPTNLVQNAGFENYESATSSPPWQRVYQTYFYSIASLAQSGSGFALIESLTILSGTNSSVAQTLSGLSTASTYTLSFYYRPFLVNPYFNAAIAGRAAYFIAYVDSEAVATITLTVQSQSASYTQLSVAGIRPQSATPVLKFELYVPRTVGAGNVPVEVLLDSVDLEENVLPSTTLICDAVPADPTSTIVAVTSAVP